MEMGKLSGFVLAEDTSPREVTLKLFGDQLYELVGDDIYELSDDYKSISLASLIRERQGVLNFS